VKYHIRELVFRVLRHPILALIHICGGDASRIRISRISSFVRSDSPVIIEAGAFDGQDTKRFLNAWSNCKIFAFEPVPNLADRLSKLFDGEERVSVIEKSLVGGISRDVTMYTFQMDSVPNGSSSILQPTGHLDRQPTIDLAKTIQVTGVTLDEWAESEGVGAVDILWLDLQGAELDVLRSANSLLSRTHIVHVEISDEPLYLGAAVKQQVIDFLHTKGFRPMLIRQLGISGNALFVKSP
jgi:2-O-methyltransferase